ncbi:transcription antitermination factor NusB [Candidatus Saccharibacteria bacterium]|nr:transcription antitermination factor NusB [Candidatus Saccharibacteria bacterium]
MREIAKDPALDLDKVIIKSIKPYEVAVKEVTFLRQLVEGVAEHTKELDEILQPLAPEWPLMSISPIDRNILRLATYELLYRGDDVPPSVAINEAVELAKMFGSESSSRFVNGVLGTLYRTRIAEDATPQGPKKAPTPKKETSTDAEDPNEKVD